MAKKSKFLVGFLLLGSLIAGCSNGSVDTHADVSFGSEVITTNKGDNLTVAELYIKAKFLKLLKILRKSYSFNWLF